jgi:hypothetical protein
MRGRRFAGVLLCALLGGVPPAAAQTGASIEGIVADSTGGALPGATVQVTNEGTGITREVVTDAEGRYVVRDLALGEYRVEAALPGFRTSVRRGIVLTIGREAQVSLELGIGEISEEVVVSGDAPLVDTSSAGATSLVSREQMADLPLAARDFSQLIALQAGTVHVRIEAGSGQNAGAAAGARISISGARPSSNVFVLDGTEIQTAYGILPSGVGGATLGLEAVQEFKIQTNNYSAQYGRSVGGTVVAATRSGTNQLRGSGYWYHRNDAFDSRNFFDSGEKPDFRRNQFGAGLGGPIIRNRTFFFGNYEVLRELLPRRLSAEVPTAEARAGNLPGRTVTVSPVVKPYLDLYPLPNGRDFGDGTAEYTSGGDRPTDQDYASIRVDHQFTANSKIFGRYTRDVSDLVSPNAIPLFNDTTLSQNHYTTFEQSQVLSSRLVNQARIGFTRSRQGTAIEAVNAPDPSLDFYPGRGFGTIVIDGVSDLSGGTGQNTDTVDALIVADDATFDTGRQSIHVGGAFTWLRYERISWGDRFAGQFEYGSLVDFLLENRPTRLRISGFNADPEREYKNRLLNLYVQDDIRFGSNLVFNIGLRYEYLTTPSESDGRLANLRQITDEVPTVGEPYYENPGGFLSPRIGVVWDPTGSGATSVRAGFGVFHEPLMMKNYVVTMTRQPPFWFEVDPRGAQLDPLFPNVAPYLEELTRVAPQAIHVFQFDANNPYSMQGSLSVQRQLGANLVAELAYVGSRGVHLNGRKDWAVPEREVVDGETFLPATANYVNPTFTRLHYYDTSASSWYHALKTTVTKRFSQGLHFQGAYTWSKALDTESATIAGELSGTTVQDPYENLLDWGPAAFHTGHTFTGSASYRFPWGENMSGIAGGFARGWQVSGIVTASEGRPFSVSSNGALTHSLVRFGVRPDLAPGGNPNPVLGGVEQYFDPLQFVPQRRGYFGNLGRNTLVGPGLLKVDLSVVKDVTLGGTRTLQLRAEVFNLFNRANFSNPNGDLFNARGARLATAGRITNTTTTARQGQVAVRFAF